MMELREFVREALAQIVEGATDARERVRAQGALLNPPPENMSGLHPHQWVKETRQRISMVSFDVALTAAEESGRKAGLAVVAGVLSAGTGGGRSESNVSVSRVRFEIPLALPLDERNEP